MRGFIQMVLSDFIWEFEVIAGEDGRPRVRYKFIRENTWAYGVLFGGLAVNCLVLYAFGRFAHFDPTETVSAALAEALRSTGLFYAPVMALRLGFNRLTGRSNSLLTPFAAVTVFVFIKTVFMLQGYFSAAGF